jgi:uncharacterized membrane protein YdjX (TVP38/TMEM64 family)/pimeloyl-ACP methyl ester carboxylesterase
MSEGLRKSLLVYSYAKQVRAVLIIELLIILSACLIAFLFWTNLCDTSLKTCVSSGAVLGPAGFLLLAALRPLVFTPFLFVAILGGDVFGPYWGTLLSALGAVASAMIVFGITKLVGKRLAKPWLRSNLPATHKLIRSQDYKLVFGLRLIPFIPFDLLSFAFGALDFRTKSVAIATFFGALPEAYMYAKLVDPDETVIGSTLITLMTLALCIFLPLLAFEFISRKKGTSFWQLTRAMYREITYEVHTNNEIVKRTEFDPTKTPVLLLYGFFSSRRAVTVLERMLTARGHQVFSFNLGGLFGTFFTRGILETANFVDYKIKRQVERHGFKRFHVVAHSKGGLVALWWILKLGGSRYCKKVVTMGSPFRGTRLTYLALVTPLGFLWRDVWQMRPGSMFIRNMHDVEIPEDVEVYCMHSVRDKVAKGEKGLFKPRTPSKNIHSIPMNHISHFEFLYRRDVGDVISQILRKEEPSLKLVSGEPED